MSVTMMLMIRMSLRIQASCSVHCRLVEESDVCNGDVGDNDDCGLMEVSDVCDDDVDDKDVTENPG